MSARTTDDIPVEAFLAGYPEAIRARAEILRRVVRTATPEARESVRAGWRIIGYDLPIGRSWRYFAFVGPEPKHVHLGFAYGAWMDDPDRRLEGAHLRLRKVRFLTFQPNDEISELWCLGLTREAARVAYLPAAAREAGVRLASSDPDPWRPGSGEPPPEAPS
jgi:hypothetical protein